MEDKIRQELYDKLENELSSYRKELESQHQLEV